MDQRLGPDPGSNTGSLNVVNSCPRCRGSVDQGFVGTNGRVFWSDERHILSAFGDEVLIPIALLTTNYRPASICRSCGLVALLYDSEDAPEPDLDKGEKLGETPSSLTLGPSD